MVVMPDETRINTIQEELTKLLFGNEPQATQGANAEESGEEGVGGYYYRRGS